MVYVARVGPGDVWPVGRVVRGDGVRGDGVW
mgnify:CR=1 FL=1